MSLNYTKISKQMSKLLRHKPDTLKMDEKGWVDSYELCKYLHIEFNILQYIVEINDKQRFVFNNDKTKICAAQGHSIGIATEKKYIHITAPDADFLLYHGTDDKTAELIKKDKIIPGNRQYVHWTENIETAKKRANQRSIHNKTKPVIISLNVKSYIHGGGKLLMAENGVYLTSEIDGKILNYNIII